MTSFDLRRLSSGALLTSAIYAIVLNLPDPTAVKIGFGLMLTIGMWMIMLFAPMPKWRESEQRLRVSAAIAFFFAAFLAVIVTLEYVLQRRR